MTKNYEQSFKDLTYHIKCVHEGLKEYVCDTCGQPFGMKKSLKRHIETIHEGRKYYCDFCNKQFNFKSALYRHLHQHKETLNLKCEHCSKNFIRKESLKSHIKLVHPEWFVEETS